VRLVFFGTPEIAVPSLEALAAGHQLLAVVAQPDKPQARSATPAPPPTKVWALEHGVPCVQPIKLNDGTFEAWLRDNAPDACPLVAYGRILKQPLLEVPRHGFINMHPSLLPKYRGPSPLQTAILNGDEVTGITVMRLDPGMDTGPILMQKQYPIFPDDTTASLSERLAKEGAQMLADSIDLLAAGRAEFHPQPEQGVSVTRTFSKEDGRVRWGDSARQIHNLVRAAVPWPVAHCKFRGAVCRIYKTEVITETTDAAPGTVTSVTRDSIVVAARGGQLSIQTLQMPGKRAMTTAEFLRGTRVSPGDRFEDL
jgi:methionyl-tRNA formyltransferase